MSRIKRINVRYGQIVFDLDDIDRIMEEYWKIVRAAKKADNDMLSPIYLKKIRKQPKNSLEWKLQSILKRHLVREAVGKFSEHSTLAQQDMQNLSIRSQH